ncbi:MAG TPA: YedE-related selenium metabolism membrane protein [Firmicutes bacterium]|nr:YedE-related selenium metabolism membrane protein [Bacillota bacterium]
MSDKQSWLNTYWPVIAGASVGVLAPILVKLGNPGNMGVCVACFTRDISGALGLHKAATVQYLRPEIMGIVLGALAAALLFREFRPRTGSAPIVRFLLGAFAMIGALVFLGCPWRAYLRLSGGDWNALYGLVGLVAGIWAGIGFLRAGFSLGRSRPAPATVGWVMPGLMLILIVVVVYIFTSLAGSAAGPIYFSTSGPGSQHAPWLVSLAVGLVIGTMLQRSRLCTVGAVRDMIMLRDPHLLRGIIALVGAAFLTNLLLGQFRPGFAGQPVAHTAALWNFAGMVLAGLAFTLAGGCPGRQLILAGEGDGDAGIFVLGMLVGAGFAHNFSLASSPAGPGTYGPVAVVIGLLVCAVFGFSMREREIAG